MAGHPSALALMAGVLATLLTPPEKILPSVWAAKHLIVPDGPKAGEKWSAELTPYIIEPLDMLAPDSGVNKVVIRKSAQTGFTTLALAFIGHSIDTDPCRMMVVQPTESALNDFNRDKLGECIEQTPVLRRKVRSQVSRSGAGSTAYSKRFNGGSLTLAIATSSADLRSKTIKKVVKDEASGYPADLDGQGSPHAMIEVRYESFRRTEDWKELNISTPVLKGECYIDQEFETGDKRYWHIECPGCGEAIYFVFDKSTFRYNAEYPYNAHYVPPCCGVPIEAHQKYDLVAKTPFKWIATDPGPGKHVSYHFDALSSPLVPWDLIAERAVLAGDDPVKQKGFYNLTLGLAFEMKGDVPDYERLMERREDYGRFTLPPPVLMLVGSADIQMRGIYYEILGLAPDAQSWVIDAGYLDGDTSDPAGGAFALLDEVYHKTYADAFGNQRGVDMFGVDSGYRSHVVYSWVRARPKAHALKGAEGWSRPALGTPAMVDIDFGNRKIKNGATVRAVGTWSLKASLYSNLRKAGAKAGAEFDPPGYCHFGAWQDDIYFKQITAEYLGETKFKGRMRKEWKLRNNAENHFLDCRVYNMALADFLGLSRMTPAEWAELARQRGAESLVSDDGMFAPDPLRVQQARAAKAVVAVAPTKPEQKQDNWLDGFSVDI